MPKTTKKLRWPTCKEQHAYMRERQLQNEALAKRNPNENWMWEKLKNHPEKWRRQSRWGYRIFDFWCHRLGVAIEVDGPEHNPEYDSYRDRSVLENYGIRVYRVRNMNEDDARLVFDQLSISSSWNDRREIYGLKRIHNAD